MRRGEGGRGVRVVTRNSIQFIPSLIPSLHCQFFFYMLIKKKKIKKKAKKKLPVESSLEGGYSSSN